MSRLFSILFSLLVFQSSAWFTAAQSADTGNRRCLKDFCIQVVANSTTGMLTYNMTTSSAATGWYAVGTGSQMAGSTMWIVWQSGNSVVWSERSGTGHFMPLPSDTTQATYLSNQSFAATQGIQAVWEIPLTTTATTAKFPLIWAANSGNQLGASASSALSQHTAYGNFKMDLTQPVSGNGTVATGAGSSSDSGETTGSTSNYSKFVKVHAIVMAIAWGIAAPIAIVIARFGRSTRFRWIIPHQYLQLVGTALLTIIGFVFAILATSASGAKHFGSSHQIVGLVVIIIMLIQALGGLYSHYRYDAKRLRRPIQNWLHMFFGMAVLIIAWVNLWLGIALWQDSVKWKRILLIVWGVVLACALIMGYGMIPRQVQQQRERCETADHNLHTLAPLETQESLTPPMLGKGYAPNGSHSYDASDTVLTRTKGLTKNRLLRRFSEVSA